MTSQPLGVPVEVVKLILTSNFGAIGSGQPGVQRIWPTSSILIEIPPVECTTNDVPCGQDFSAAIHVFAPSSISFGPVH